MDTVDLANATAADINELREAFRVEKFSVELLKRFYKSLVTEFPDLVAEANSELNIEFLNFKSVNKDLV